MSGISTSGTITGLFLVFMLLGYSTQAQTKGAFVDERDGRSYETVTYTIKGAPKTITDHDEYGTYLSGETKAFEASFPDGAPSSITWMTRNLNYDTTDSKCQYESDENCETHGRLYTWDDAMNVCPAEWHLPSDEEWFLLASLYDSVASAGKHLKSKDLNGTNKSRFNVKKSSIFWSSFEIDAESAMDWKVNYRWEKLQRWKGGKGLFNSVRCVQDY